MASAPSKGLYILHLSLHGLIRGHDLELGRDADTGGQTLYVVELARALSQRRRVARVDLMTRWIDDPTVGPDYAKAVEKIAPKARILRIPAGGGDYIRKELLWDHLDNLTDTAVEILRSQGRLPDIIHSHYADAGYVGTRLAKLFGRPLIHTGHSLGRVKRLRLLAAGMEGAEIEARYAMRRRIDAEEETLSNADLVVASTHNEIAEQYELYDCYHPDGMAVIPPGVNLTRFHPPTGGEADTRLAAEIGRFLRDPGKPMVLAIARPDERKNLPILVETFGTHPRLRRAANLVIVPGTRDDIRDMEDGPQDVLKDLLLAIDRYDLYGSVALPKAVTDIPLMYRLAVSSRGVFVNPALTEPFGLTLLEAAASGLPVVATRDGGPTDIVRNCRNGRLIDPLDPADIGRALLAILSDEAGWQRMHTNGLKAVARRYSWPAHAVAYLDRIETLPDRARAPRARTRRHTVYADRALVADLDQALIGDEAALAELAATIRAERKTAAFGIATGRPLDSALRVIRRHGIPAPDILISALGSEIHYGRELVPDGWWARHIDHQWNPRAVRHVLDGLDGLVLQPQEQQSPFKVSYYYDAAQAPGVTELQTLLYHAELTINLTLSFGQYLDILPSRASKGLALRYAAHQMDIALDRILVAGASAGDADMMRGNTLSVIVADRHDDELSELSDLPRMFRPQSKHAAGILEAISAFDFYGACAFPEEPPT
jgi:sucrose-phosphate synthase